MTTVLLYVALPGAAMILGALLGAMLTRGIDRRPITPVDDRPFIDQWRADLAEHPAEYWSDADEADVQEALELVRPVRPLPYPPLRAVE